VSTARLTHDSGCVRGPMNVRSGLYGCHACTRTHHAAAPLGALAGVFGVWLAYPALTPAFKHDVLPFIFPNPEPAPKADE
jgi:hypothetical protein